MRLWCAAVPGYGGNAQGPASGYAPRPSQHSSLPTLLKSEVTGPTLLLDGLSMMMFRQLAPSQRRKLSGQADAEADLPYELQWTSRPACHSCSNSTAGECTRLRLSEGCRPATTPCTRTSTVRPSMVVKHSWPDRLGCRYPAAWCTSQGRCCWRRGTATCWIFLLRPPHPAAHLPQRRLPRAACPGAGAQWCRRRALPAPHLGPWRRRRRHGRCGRCCLSFTLHSYSS